ncbi:hypothetical protein DYB36_013378 [Aphanomyces astaci]|uniref:Uncharacterized protein n=1 Tax=Aphanomyces astaci TaxID=112090 RepID=A0A396ZYF1_APHAT|nr:hypothetical protein DYB36_013378 [Aphanomyces astaci]
MLRSITRVLSSCNRWHGSCNINNTATGREDIPTNCRKTLANAASHATSTGTRQTPPTTAGSGSDQPNKQPSAFACVEVEEQDANSFFDQTSVPVELPTKPKQTNTPPTDTAESTVKIDDMEPQQAPLHRRGREDFSAFGEDVVKMEATARMGEPSADMKDFGDLEPPHMALLTVPTPSPLLQVEDIPMLDNIMDDEQHAAVETEPYESAWPAGMIFGDDAKDVDPDQTT